MVMTSILGLDGKPMKIDKATLNEPQTAKLLGLHHEFQGHPSRGLTPSKLAGILDQAERGNMQAQFELYEDMEEKDGHVYAEMGKRRRALLSLEAEVVPPPNASKKEQDNARILGELLEGLDDFEDVLFDITDAIGKGFACLEFGGWSRTPGERLPLSINHRPQTWFTTAREIDSGPAQSIRLRGPAGGEPLNPFGWITHIHKAKSGYLERSALFRVLVWPYLFKNYSVGDLAEFLEIYGIPMRVGKYPGGASNAEKLTLLRALAQIGHNAAGIIPAGMEVDFHNATTGDPDAYNAMIGWAERTQSKAILGGTLTSDSSAGTNTNALGNVHNECRLDLRDADAIQVAKTISRDLIYPIAIMNGLATDWRRCPRYRFDVSEPEDLTVHAEALPKLVAMGYRIGRQWAQERVGIPEPEEGEDILATAPAPQAPGLLPPPDAEQAPDNQTALSAQLAQAIESGQPQPPQQMGEQLAQNLSQPLDQWINTVRDLAHQVTSLEELRDRLLTLYPQMTLDDYAAAMRDGLAVANLAGRAEVIDE
jgi:phage gp29-like protein